MRIKKKVSQHRRDFNAIYVCEHCEHEHEDYGYDDHNFHVNVIPNMKCPECGETAPQDAPKTMPDVPAHVVI
jgi:rubrerythrin